MKSHPFSPGRRNPTPMADLVDLCPTIKDEKQRHGGNRDRGKINKAEIKNK